MKKLVAILISFLLLISLSACSSSEMNYFNKSFKYHNLEITVTSVEESIDNNGNYSTTVSFSATNTGTHEYDFYLSDIYLKNAETKSKYDSKTSLLDALVEEVIDGGLTKNYDVKFTLPSSVSESKYIMYFDFGSLGSPAGECALYYEDGSMIDIENNVSNDNTENNEGSNNNTENNSHYFNEPCPISISVMYFTSDQTLSITHTNQSGKTIAAIKYLIVVYDAYGEELKKYGYGVSALTATYDNWNTSPGGRNTGDWKLNGFDSGKSIDIYIYSVLFTDNTEYGNKNLTVSDIKSYAPKNHIVGRYA